MPTRRSAHFPSSEYPREYGRSLQHNLAFIFIGIVAICVAVGNMLGHDLATAVLHLSWFGVVAVFTTFGLYILISAGRLRVVLDLDSIEITGLRGRRRILHEEIAGRYTEESGDGPSTLILMLKGEPSKQVRLPLTFEPDAAFYAWFEGIPNFDERRT